jgi:hypothetical protein
VNAIQLRQETLEVSVRADAVAARDEIITKAQAITSIGDEMDEADAADVLKELIKLERGVEQTRTAIKAPLLDAGRQVDSIAKQFTAPVAVEVARFKTMLGKFDMDRRARIAAEELKRKQEAEAAAREKMRAEAEARRREEEARAAAEKARLAAEAEFMASDTAEQEKAAAEAKAAQERAAAEQAAALAARAKEAEASAAQLQLSVQSAVKAPAKPIGIGSRMVWKFEVADIRALYAARPELVTLEPKSREIERALAIGAELPGVRSWQESSVSVRV